MAGAGYKLFNTGDVLTAQQVNEYLMQQTVMVFADAAARTTALSGIVAEGMMSYLKDTNKTYRYDGSAWLDDAGTTSPLTTKGDVWTYSTTDARLASSGVNGQVLTVDTSTSTGLKWAAAGGGAGNLVEIATGTLSGASVTISSLSTYSELLLFVGDSYNATANGTTQVRINNNSTSNYDQYGYYVAGSGDPLRRYLNGQDNVQLLANITQDRANAQTNFMTRFFNTKNAGFTSFDVTSFGVQNGGNTILYNAKGIYKVSEAVSSLVIYSTGGNWSGGTYTLWGG